MVDRYDLKETTKIYIEDLLLLTAMGPPGGSRQDVYARFLRHFDIFAINSFSDESMTRIFSTILFIGLKVKNTPTLLSCLLAKCFVCKKLF